MQLSLVLYAILLLVLGGVIGFYIAQKFFPQYDYSSGGLKHIVSRVEKQKQAQTYEPTPPPKVGETLKAKYITKGHMVVEVSVIAEEKPNKTSKFLKKGSVAINVPGYSSWEVWSDEGRLGAGDQAPCPLDYLTLGMAFCLLSHLRLAAEAMRMDPGEMTIELRGYYGQYGGFGKEGTYGATEAIKTHIVINSKLPKEELMTLIQRGQRNCYASAGFLNNTPMETKVFINGKNVY
tara:strand:+ start:126 stop:830 length:705 start_codon:yes stop_codon:yes gene_type:complete